MHTPTKEWLAAFVAYGGSWKTLGNVVIVVRRKYKSFSFCMDRAAIGLSCSGLSSSRGFSSFLLDSSVFLPVPACGAPADLTS